MNTLAAVRAAMATALDGISGLSCSPYLTDSLAVPAGGAQAMIDVSGPARLVFADGGFGWTFTITVFAQRNDERSSQVYLDGLRDVSLSTSIKETIENDSALGALVSYGTVGPSSETRVIQIAGATYLVVEFPVEVVLQ